jgi:hypothetical protein
MAVTAVTRRRIEVRPIAPDDLPRVAQFLHAYMNARVPVSAWSRALHVPWKVLPPNAGFKLVDGPRIVGAQLAFYSERSIDGRNEQFCNLGALCVLPEYRLHALRLVTAVLAQDGYHFTDLSPSGSVVGLNTRLGFRFLDTTTAMMPNLPWPSRPGRDTISSDPSVIRRALRGRDLELYRDHAAAPAARHLVLIRGESHCYVMFRKDRRKGLPLFATVLHVGNPELFRRMLAPFARHLLLRYGVVATLLERAAIDCWPRLSLSVGSPRRKMFKSPDLRPSQVDYLYSELVCLSW